METSVLQEDRDILPIQVLDSRKLALDENFWLKGLGSRLEAAEIGLVASEIARLRAYYYVAGKPCAVSGCPAPSPAPFPETA